MRKLSALIISSLLFTGCATTKSIQYPTPDKETSISIYSEQLSSMNESGAGDYFIKNSQILVGEASNASSSTVSGMFGLIGVGVAIAIDKNANSGVIQNSTLNQPIKFDQLTHEKVTNLVKSDQIDPKIKLLALNQISDIKVVPYSRLSFREKPNVKVIFGLKTEFKNAADNNAQTKRFYYYVSKQHLPLNTWDSENNKLFNQEADKAFSALSEVFLIDLQHKLNLTAFDENRQKDCKNSADTAFVSFIQSPDNLCIGVAKNAKGQVTQNGVYIVEQ